MVLKSVMFDVHEWPLQMLHACVAQGQETIFVGSTSLAVVSINIL